VENFIVIYLNTRKRATGWGVVSTGTLDTILIHPREVFRMAILNSSAAIVIMHNHPSGDPTPSEADIKATRDMYRAGQLLKIEVLDSVVIGTPDVERIKDYVSLREMGYLL
jgi:DNA repair protein RadC